MIDVRPLGAILAVLSLMSGTRALGQPAPSCPKGLKPQAVAEMIFGRNIGEITAGVSEEEWVRFLDETVTPRFPSGFTVIDAYGQWWDPPAGRVEREPSKMLLIVMQGEARQQSALGEIATEYKRRFSQKSVILMLRRACASF